MCKFSDSVRMRENADQINLIAEVFELKNFWLI